MEKIVEIKWDEIWPISNILNEVCHGININDFKNEIGFKYEEIVDLLHKLNKLEPKNTDYNSLIIFKLNDSEQKILLNSFKEVLRQIDEWEFQTRSGVTIQEANDIINKVL
ncbi:MAG: hypothetical protein JSR57_11760 [Verrucomicrobia bacterium]|nr:hypothetical protein [Verrucomicrobiota bacterium]